jgi:hypothetical protein
MFFRRNGPTQRCCFENLVPFWKEKQYSSRSCYSAAITNFFTNVWCLMRRQVVSNCVKTHPGNRCRNSNTWHGFGFLSSRWNQYCCPLSVGLHPFRKQNSIPLDHAQSVSTFKWSMSCVTITEQNLVETQRQNGSWNRNKQGFSFFECPQTDHQIIFVHCFVSQYSRLWLVWWLFVSPRVPF